MGLKPCVECKKEVSTSAKACPHCGKKNPTVGPGAKVVSGVIVALLALWICKAVATSADSEQSSSHPASLAPAAASAPRAPSEHVDAVRLWQAYEANEVAADAAYKGKVLEVAGVVTGIDKDFLGNIIVNMRSPNQFMPTRATLVKSEERRAAELSKGDRVTLTCECRGRIVGSPSLDDCRF
jgi:hypothetical protein